MATRSLSRRTIPSRSTRPARPAGSTMAEDLGQRFEIAVDVGGGVEEVRRCPYASVAGPDVDGPLRQRRADLGGPRVGEGDAGSPPLRIAGRHHLEIEAVQT